MGRGTRTHSPAFRTRTADTQWIKATYPMGLTMWALSWSAMSYGPGFEAAKQTAYMDSTLRWGYDWLMKVGTAFDSAPTCLC